MPGRNHLGNDSRRRKCHFCFGMTTEATARQFAGRFCSKACVDGHGSAHESARKHLKESGFEQHPEAPNVWMKNGVALTEQEIVHDGIELCLDRHSRVGGNPLAAVKRAR